MKMRKCSGAVVFRVKNNRPQILLVKSNSGGWTIPKGGIEKHLSPEENAIKEVFEESGAVGKILNNMGYYKFVKNNIQQEVSVFFMNCVFTTKKYPERKLRKRKWFSVKEALRKMPTEVARMLSSRFQNTEIPAQ